MPEMYVKYRGEKPYAYMYGDESAAMALYCEDGYRTPEEAKAAYERTQKNKQEEINETNLV